MYLYSWPHLAGAILHEKSQSIFSYVLVSHFLNLCRREISDRRKILQPCPYGFLRLLFSILDSILGFLNPKWQIQYALNDHSIYAKLNFLTILRPLNSSQTAEIWNKKIEWLSDYLTSALLNFKFVASESKIEPK